MNTQESRRQIPPMRVPHRFRRRLLLLLLCAGLAPLLVWGGIGNYLLRQGLSIAPPIDPLLEKVTSTIESTHPASPLGDEIRLTQLQLVQADLARRSLQRRIPYYFGGSLILSTMALLGLAYALGRRVARPIETLTGGIQRFATGDLSHQIPSTGRGDELDFAISEFNRMGHKLLSQRERLRVTEQLAAWQDVARAMAHDLKNPLTAMKMAMARLLRPDPTVQAQQEATQLLTEEIDRLLRMTQSFSAFAKLPAPVCQPLHLVPLLKEVAALYQHMAVPVQVSAAADHIVIADGDLLRRAFGNLLKNAIEASQPHAQPVLIQVTSDGIQISIEIADDGTGIAAPIEGPALTRSLGSTKVGGSGLGLPVAYKIIFDHGGNLHLAPRQPRGTLARVTLPLAEVCPPRKPQA